MRLWLRPGLLVLHVLVVVAVVFCLFMGLWQLGVYDARQQDERADRQQVPTVALQKVMGPNDAFSSRANHRPVTVTGEFAPAADQLWVSGRSQGGTDGAWLVAPFVTESGNALLVVRGFGQVRSKAPAPPTGSMTLSAVLEPGESAGGTLDDNRVIDSLRIPELINELPYDLYSAYAINTSPEVAAPLALVEVPEPGGSWTTGLRNLAYTFQWWVFGAFAVFMWWRMCTESVAASRAKVA
ncbi:MAG: hypothetical protein JWP10_1752 [Nocardioidaceae bacterium]|nr:hypothetical protein [Nocardioidaceae bacterium]